MNMGAKWICSQTDKQGCGQGGGIQLWFSFPDTEKWRGRGNLVNRKGNYFT